MRARPWAHAPTRQEMCPARARVICRKSETGLMRVIYRMSCGSPSLWPSIRSPRDYLVYWGAALSFSQFAARAPAKVRQIAIKMELEARE